MSPRRGGAPARPQWPAEPPELLTDNARQSPNPRVALANNFFSKAARWAVSVFAPGFAAHGPERRGFDGRAASRSRISSQPRPRLVGMSRNPASVKRSHTRSRKGRAAKPRARLPLQYGKGVPRISSKHQITLPVDTLKRAGLQAGDEVAIEADGTDRIGRAPRTRPTSTAPSASSTAYTSPDTSRSCAPGSAHEQLRTGHLTC